MGRCVEDLGSHPSSSIHRFTSLSPRFSVHKMGIMITPKLFQQPLLQLQGAERLSALPNFMASEGTSRIHTQEVWLQGSCWYLPANDVTTVQVPQMAVPGILGVV